MLPNLQGILFGGKPDRLRFGRQACFLVVWKLYCQRGHVSFLMPARRTVHVKAGRDAKLMFRRAICGPAFAASTCFHDCWQGHIAIWATYLELQRLCWTQP